MLVKSSDPIELSGICDRVLVMSRGRIVDEIAASELDEQAIVEAMVGSKATDAAGGVAVKQGFRRAGCRSR